MSVQIAIDHYDDLFSDFDIRSYEERYISTDFLNELRMRTSKLLNKKEIKIIIKIDEKERNTEDEKIISERLKSFFKNRYERNMRKKKQIILNAVVLELFGIAFMLIANFLGKYAIDYFKDFMLIPAWFFVWNGLDKYIFNKKVLEKKAKYYSILNNSTIIFE
jgi:hypothetical protein